MSRPTESDRFRQRMAPPGRTLWIASTDGSSPARLLVNQECNRALFAPDGEIYFVGGGDEGMYLQKIKADGTGLAKVVPGKGDVPLRYFAGREMAGRVDVSPYRIKIFRSDGTLLRWCALGAHRAARRSAGSRRRYVSWSRDGTELYLYSEDLHQLYAVPLKSGQVLPPIPPDGLSGGAAAAAIAGVRTIPQRAFMSGDSQLYAYLQVSAHRNIYRILVP